MKILKNLSKSLLKVVCLVALTVPLMVSCTKTIVEEYYYENDYDDTKIWENLNLLIGKVYDLEQKFNSEIKTLQDLLKGKVFITEVTQDTSTGVTVVTLSNGQTLALLPEKDMESFVTYLTLSDGISYWAYIDENGKKQLFLDENNEAIPVAGNTPEVVVRDGETFLVIGGVEYPLAGNSVFSDYELIMDEATGEVYAVTFTFGDDMSFTVTVDGAAGFDFVMPSGWSTVIITDYYVPAGVTEKVQLDARGVVDYVLQIPDGWRVKETEDPYMGTKYFDITAPSVELITSGVAAADGELKVVAVLEGGKATVSKLYLSTDPFKKFEVSLAGATVKMYNGLQKFVYGICKAAEYDETAIFDVAEGLLMAYDYPDGYGVADYDLEDLPLAEVNGAPLVPGEKYVFWAIPALYYYTDTDAGYYLKEGTFKTVNLNYASLSFEIGRESFRDAELIMEVKGVDAYYMAVTKADEFMMEDVLYGLNNGYYDSVTEPMSYEGSIFTLAGVTPEPSTEYVAWIAVAEDGKKEYTESDVIVREFSTLNLTAGSSVKVVADKETVGAFDVVVDLTASGAENIYYTYLTPTDAKKYADDSARANYLFENGEYADATTVQAKASDVITKIKPEMDVVLFAVATDEDGKYGEVLVAEYKTTALQYNDMVVEISLARNDPDDVRLNISAKGGEVVEWLYWIGKTSDNTWRSANYLGGSAETAQVYMYLNPTNSRFVSTAEKYPVVDGLITMNDLAYNTNYVIVAMAKDSDGLYSKAVEFRFEPRAVAIGTIVTSEDPKWKEAEPKIEFIMPSFRPASGMMPGNYAVNITLPLGYTGYVLLGTDAYLNDGDTSVEVSMEEKILKIIEYADIKRDVGLVVDENAWETQGYPYGYEFYHFEHGSPAYGSRPGSAVIWGSREFHDSRCDCLINPPAPTKIINGVEMPVEHVVLFNDGTPVRFVQPSAIGSTSEVIDRIFVVCQDADGNCYQTYEYDVPFEYFRDATIED